MRPIRSRNSEHDYNVKKQSLKTEWLTLEVIGNTGRCRCRLLPKQVSIKSYCGWIWRDLISKHYTSMHLNTYLNNYNFNNNNSHLLKKNEYFLFLIQMLILRSFTSNRTWKILFILLKIDHWCCQCLEILYKIPFLQY